jgi:hypothetical protein
MKFDTFVSSLSIVVNLESASAAKASLLASCLYCGVISSLTSSNDFTTGSTMLTIFTAAYLSSTTFGFKRAS